MLYRLSGHALAAAINGKWKILFSIAICEKPQEVIDSAVHMSVISEAWLQLHTYPTCKNVTASNRPTEKVLYIKPNVER